MIFGKVYPPNSVQPGWFLEGLATYEESRNTTAGRLRSSIFDMYLRMDALEDRLLRLDQISNEVDRFPRGNVRYLYGSRFVEFIARRYGDEALRDMTHDYGSQLIPYGVNRTARRATGKTFIELYDEWTEETRGRYRRQAARIRRAGLVRGRNLTNRGQHARAPRFLDNRRIVYYADDGRDRQALRIIDAYSGERLGELDRARGSAYSSPHPDGRHVYYSALEAHRDIYYYYDLFRVDRETGVRERLTRGMRAQEPDVSPDGRRIAFTINGASTTHLAIADIADIEGTYEVAYRSPQFNQVYTPKWSPDGRTIAFSAWREGGYRDILLLDVASGDVTELTHDRAVDIGPAWSPDGRYLYFSSDRTGVQNVYAHERSSGTLYQVTNVIAGAYSPTISPDGRRLAYLGFRSHGWDIFGMDLHPARFRVAEPYVTDRQRADPVPEAPPLESEPYNPLATFLPRTWFLTFGQDGFGSAVGASVQAGDVVGFHSYTGNVSVGLVRGNVNADLTYVYQRTPLPITISAFHGVAPRGGLVVAGEPEEWIERSFGGEIGIRYSFPRAFNSEIFTLSYRLSYLDNIEPISGAVLDPNDPVPVLPQEGLLAGLRAGWSWSDVVRTAWDITPSEGRRITLGLNVSHPLMGSQFTAVSGSWSITQYVENPFIQHHVFAFRYSGGISGGDLGRRGLFSLGGFPETNVLDQLVNQTFLGGQALRGYAPFDRRGTQFHLVQAEYRFPIHRLMWTVETLPAYIQRIWASAFVDWGDAFFGDPDLGQFRFGVGGELFIDFLLGYFLTYTLRIGIARGLSDGGGTYGYVHLGLPF